jgi:hypothetical protein
LATQPGGTSPLMWQVYHPVCAGFNDYQEETVRRITTSKIFFWTAQPRMVKRASHPRETMLKLRVLCRNT